MRNLEPGRRTRVAGRSRKRRRAGREPVVPGGPRAPLLVKSVAALLLVPGAAAVLPQIAGGFPPAKLDFTRRLLYCLLPVLLLAALSGVGKARRVADRRFLPAALAPAMVPAVTIAAIAFRRRKWGAYSLAAGTVAGALLEVSVLARALVAGAAGIVDQAVASRLGL